jgi:glycosyltransferase involved in cell wall biosynthesis
MAPQNDILIDVSRLVWRVSSGRLPTGIDRVCLAYIEHYRHRAQAVIQWKAVRRILSPASSRALFDLLLSNAPHFRRALALQALRASPHLLRSEQGRNRLYLNIGHTGLDRAGLAKWMRKVDVRPVFMIHDLIPITHPEYCRVGETARHEKRVDLMLDTGVGIIGNSRATLDILADYARRRGRVPPPMLAAWLGATPLPAQSQPNVEIQTPFFVTLGTIEGRKNHVLLLKVWQRLVAKHGPAAPRLIIVGQRGWENDEALAMLDGQSGLDGHVLELSRCTDADLAHYLREARALLFPSFAEGYGMPLVEALGHGTPVIASHLPVFRELSGDIPDYLDPTDASGWLAAIEDYCRDDSRARIDQTLRLASYDMPDWAGHFVKVDRWLAQLAKS